MKFYNLCQFVRRITAIFQNSYVMQKVHRAALALCADGGVINSTSLCWRGVEAALPQLKAEMPPEDKLTFCLATSAVVIVST